MGVIADGKTVVQNVRTLMNTELESSAWDYPARGLSFWCALRVLPRATGGHIRSTLHCSAGLARCGVPTRSDVLRVRICPGANPRLWLYACFPIGCLACASVAFTIVFFVAVFVRPVLRCPSCARAEVSDRPAGA